MKRNTLTTAVLAGLTGMAGMVSVSNAVNVNPDGLGQVLLYPYYSARGGNDTLVSVVNTTDQAKAVKVRFIEALNSREVLDFNLYLSPYDVWTAAVTVTDEGGGRMLTSDTSCTVPYFQGGTPGDVGEQEFLDFEYTTWVPSVGDQRFDAGPQGIERTASGYLEIIEMGTITEGTDTFSDIKHVHVDGVGDVPGGDPATACNLVQAQWDPDNGDWSQDDSFQDMRDGEGQPNPATGGLFGSASIINVSEGTMFSYNATAIDGFWAAEGDHTDPGNVFPSLSSGDNDTAFVFDNGELKTVYYDDQSIFALNAVLSFESAMNEYMIEAGVGGRTEWVVTFPTKRFHTDAAPGGPAEGANEAVPPFNELWTADGPPPGEITNHACEELDFRFWNREEREPEDAPGEIIVSPEPPDTERPSFELCREANVIRFANDDSVPEYTEILKEPSREGTFPLLGYVNFGLPEDFENGWLKFDFSDERFEAELSDNGKLVTGLPLVGFQVSRTTFGEMPTGDGGTVLSNYGGTFNHRGSRSIFSEERAD